MMRTKRTVKNQISLRYTEDAVFNHLATFGRICAIHPTTSKWCKIYPLLVITTVLALCCWSEFNKFAHQENYSSKCVFLFEVVTLALLTLFSVVEIVKRNFLEEKTVTTLLASLRELDYLMDGHSKKLLQRRQRLITVQLVAVHIFLFTACGYDIFIGVVAFNRNFLLKVPDYLNEYIMALAVLVISNYAVSINYKITALNSSLVHFVKDFLDKNEPVVLTRYLDAHNQLCNVIDSFNECYGFQIFGVFFIGVVHTTYTLYLLLVYASGRAKLKTEISVIYILLVYINFCLIFTIFGVMVTVSCTAAGHEVRRTSTICYKLLLNVPVTPKCGHERALRNELLRLAEQVSQRRIKFSVGGFLTVNYKTLYNLLGSTAMNVIVLLQFQKQGASSD